MKGFPKHINSKQDVLLCMKKWPDRTKAFVQQMIDNRHSWMIEHKLETGEAGLNDNKHKVTENTDDESKVTERTQMAWREDPNAKLFKLGFSVVEAEEQVNSVKTTRN